MITILIFSSVLDLTLLTSLGPSLPIQFPTLFYAFYPDTLRLCCPSSCLVTPSSSSLSSLPFLPPSFFFSFFPFYGCYSLSLFCLPIACCCFYFPSFPLFPNPIVLSSSIPLSPIFFYLARLVKQHPYFFFCSHLIAHLLFLFSVRHLA